MNEKISVIIPAYNVDKYIGNLLKRLKAQTYKNLEIIVINDGSKDNTHNIIEQCKINDDRIVYIKTENQGLSLARNEGLNVATGKYIAFIDGDDIVDFTYFEVLYKTLIDNSADVSVCSYKKIKEKDAYNFSVKYKEKKATNYNNIEYLKNMFTLNTVKYVVVWGKLYKAEIVKGFKFTPNVYTGEDVLFNYEVFKQNLSFAVVDLPLYGYVQRKSSIVHTFNLKKLEYLKNLDKTIVDVQVFCPELLMYVKTWYYFQNVDFLFNFWKEKVHNPEKLAIILKSLKNNRVVLKTNKKIVLYKRLFAPIGVFIMKTLIKLRYKLFSNK